MGIGLVVVQETVLLLMFSVFAVAPIYNQGLPNIYDIRKVINTVFIYSLINNYLSIFDR